MLDDIRRALALATVESSGRMQSLTGKSGAPSNDVPQALIVQIAQHLSVDINSIFGTSADAIPLDVVGTSDSVYAVVNPRCVEYDYIGIAFAKLRVTVHSTPVETDTGASLEICRCGSKDQARALVPVLSQLADLQKTAGTLRLAVTETTVNLVTKYIGNARGAAAVARLERVGAQIKEYAAGIKVYEGHPTYAIKGVVR